MLTLLKKKQSRILRGRQISGLWQSISVHLMEYTVLKDRVGFLLSVHSSEKTKFAEE